VTTPDPTTASEAPGSEAEDRPTPHATSVGQTGGLPGANAAPAASETPEDERKDTVDGIGPA